MKNRLISKIVARFKKQPSWQTIEYFDKTWEVRVAQMAAYISPGQSVMDLGCGHMSLKKYLHDNTYYPVDYTKRDESCIVCDFNKKQYPTIKTDIAFISGCLEYVKPYEWFIAAVCRGSDKVILSYCTISEFPGKRERKARAWVNHLSGDQLTDLFTIHNFRLTDQSITDSRNNIFIFSRQ